LQSQINFRILQLTIEAFFSDAHQSCLARQSHLFEDSMTIPVERIEEAIADRRRQIEYLNREVDALSSLLDGGTANASASASTTPAALNATSKRPRRARDNEGSRYQK
jgi:hypothetical protein